MARKCNKFAGLSPAVKSAILQCKQKSRELDRKFVPILKRNVKNVKKTSKKRRPKVKTEKIPPKKIGGQLSQYSGIVEMKNETSKPDVLRYEISKVVCWNYSNDSENTQPKAKSEPSNFTPNVAKTKISREGSKRASTSKVSCGASKMSVHRSKPKRKKNEEKSPRESIKSMRARLRRFYNILCYIRSRTVENVFANGDHGLPSWDEMAKYGMNPKSLKKKPKKRKVRREIHKKIIQKSNPTPKIKKLKSLVPVKLKTNLKAKKCQDLRRKIGPVPIVKVKPPNTEDEEILQEFIVKNLKKDPLFLLKCVLKKDFSKNTMVQILTTLAMAGFKTAQKRRFKKYKKVEEIRINPHDPTTKSVNYLKEIKQKETFFKVLGAILDKIKNNGQEMRFPNTSSYESCEFRQIIETANKMSDCAIFVRSYRNRLDDDREIEFGSVLSVDLGRYSKPNREMYEDDSDDDFQDALSRFDQE